MKTFSTVLEAQDYAAEFGAVLIVTDGTSVKLYETVDEVPEQLKLVGDVEPIYY